MLKRAAPTSQTQADVLHASRENGISGHKAEMLRGWDDFVIGFTAPVKLAASIALPPRLHFCLGAGLLLGLWAGRRLDSDDY